jgi:hypothetical protein
MTSSPVSPAPAGLGRPLLAFLGVIVVANAIIIGLGFAFPEFSLPSVVNLIIAMAAGMAGGQSFATRNDRAMTGGEQMRFSLIALSMSFALSAAMIGAIFVWYGVPFTLDTFIFAMTGDASVAADLKPWLWLIVALGVLIGWGVIHAGAGMGGKTVMKRKEKEATRGH